MFLKILFKEIYFLINVFNWFIEKYEMLSLKKGFWGLEKGVFSLWREVGFRGVFFIGEDVFSIYIWNKIES